ncbi:acetyl-CoA synthetase-like protein [Aspergillus tamarii]|uniref:Acetyl-CoA synthetase-like protein n=1 Tax=Aspergillus tamarii TaxID=41984 RepID=A0A5N6UAI0_ASPTM|nr:acetyl-CoA synthetase-like protein [Aspergillus tamarii]
MSVISHGPGKRQPLTDGPGIVTEFDSNGSPETGLNQPQLVSIEIGDAFKLRECCRQNMVTLSSLFQVAWGLVLRSYLASDKVCFGYFTTKSDGLGYDEDAAEMMACTIEFTPDSSLMKTLQEWSLTLLNGTTNLSVGQGPNTAIFKIYSDAKFRGTRLVDEDDEFRHEEKDKFVVNIDVQIPRVAVSLEHQASNLDHELAANLLLAFVNAITEIVARPQGKVIELDLCSKRDIEKILNWNSEAPEGSENCVHDLIRQQCVEHPGDMAVRSWDGDLTFGQLDELSSKLAANLSALGIGPEVFVPLCFEKSKWAVIAMISVMKAGGAYTFLDPDCPLNRMRSICKDLQATIVGTSTKQREIGEKLMDNVVVIGGTDMVWKQDRKLIVSVKPENALYTVFTSGSTGKPKGVLMEHGAFCAKAKANGPPLSLTRNSRVLQFANYTYDVSNRDILLTLIFGGCICIPEDSVRMNNIVAFMNQYQVNWASLTPSVANLLAPEQVPDLQHLILGGEPISTRNITSWAGKVHLTNAYGPSECAAISSILSEIKPGSDGRNIGRGIGSVLWIVDPNNHEKLVPVGAVGELIIESASVGRGYIGDDESTKASFLTGTSWLPQFRSGKLERLYKTGDLVQYAADGSLRFLGRKDTQVKLRGRRIELGEVEYHVRQCFQGARGVVAEIVTPVGGNRPPMLVVFITCENDSSDGVREAGTDELFAAPSEWHQSTALAAEARLLELVPAYMVPAVFIQLVTIPLTKTGKTDRRRLREQAAALSQSEMETYRGPKVKKRMPSTAAEQRLQQLWARLLHLPPDSIGADDSFFRLGGDSITAMKLAGVARDEGLSLSVADVFEHPKLSDLSQAMHTTSEDGMEIVALFSLLGDDETRDSVIRIAMEQCQLERNQIEDIYPCTALQEGLMALTAKKAGAYTARFSYRLPAGVDLDRFRAAWDAVADANVILRTRIIQSDRLGTFQVVVRDGIQWTSFKEQDISNAQDWKISMGLGEPLVGVAATTGEGKAVVRQFILILHHALYDAWSLPLLLNQVAAAYHGQLLHPRPFSPFIAHLSASQAAADDFWRSEFTDLNAVPFPSLPSVGYIPTPTRSLTHTIPLPQRMADDFTISTKLRLAWAIVLSQFTDTNDIVFGVTVTGRGVPVTGIDRMTGPTIATIPLRIRLEPDGILADALRKVQDHSTSMIPYEQTGLQHIIQLGEEATVACQFQNLLDIQPSQGDRLPDMFLECNTASDQGAFATYALTLQCELTSDLITVQAIFDGKVIGEPEVQRMLFQLAHIMGQIEKGLSVTITDIRGLSPEDQHQLIQWNRDVPERVNRCVHDLIWERCLAQPDAPAVCAWDGDLTYGELDQLSSTLAGHLASLGVGPEVFVPLCFEKSRWTTVAMVGVMKAGGAFVLLDPSHPLARLQEICRAVSAKLIVTSMQNETLAASLAGRAITAGNDQTTWRLDDRQTLSSSVTPDNAVYAVFTSGSTGTPKGVVIQHSAYCTGALSHGQAVGLGKDTRVFQFSSYAFDNSISDNMTTLLMGGCVCVPSEAARWNNIPQAMLDLQATLCWLTPSVAKAFQPADLPNVSTLVLTGEAPAASDIRRWVDHVNLFNDYGPAECSVITTIQRYIAKSSDPINIGFATGGVCWVVDPQDYAKLMPIGAVGELLIEGPIVGRGYINDPGKTAAAFIEPPAWLRQIRCDMPDNPASHRLYKTGDLVQYAADGSLRFLGRKDTQVKLRGQRIELGEVEHYVQQCFPGARDVVAEIVKPVGASQPPMLVAFVWADYPDDGECNGADVDLEDILASPWNGFRAAIPSAESCLLEAVPAYMVPAMFLPLVAVPLTATGKTDRRQLRQRAATLSQSAIKAYSSPTVGKRVPATAAERTLQGLWARILNVPADCIGADDSFFRLGGDSIAAMKLAGAAREEGLILAVADVFQHPKLAELSTRLQAISGSDLEMVARFSLLGQGDVQDAVLQVAMEQCQVHLQQIVDIYPCTALQEGLMALTARNPGTYINHLSYCLPGDIDLADFRAAWNAVATNNPILKTRIIQSDKLGSFQVVLSGAFEWTAYEEDSAASFGFGEPLVRASVIQSQGDGMPNRFILKMHHAIYDAWSLPLLLEQAEVAFKGQQLFHRPFSPFIAYLSQRKAAAASFWKGEFAGLNAIGFPSLHSPTYTPKPTETLTHVVSLPRGAATDFTLSAQLQLTWALTLSHYCNSRDIVFGLTVTGRGAPVVGIQQMTGPTIATIPFRIRLDLDITVAQALQGVMDHSARTIPYEHIGLQYIRNLSAEAAEACQFQTLLVIQTPRENQIPGLFAEEDIISDQGAFTTYALTVLCEPSSDSIKVQAIYDPQVLGEMDVQRTLWQLAHVMGQVNLQPDILLKDISRLSPEDHQQLGQWNGEVPERVDRCVHDLIRERCLAQPDAPAVCAWDGNLAYGELDQLSSALAGHLASLGVGPEVFVPLCFEKSRWTTEICRAVSAKLVVASGQNTAMATSLATKVIIVGDDEAAWQDNNGCWPASQMNAANAVYAILTSGTTGTPKVAVIEHAAFCSSSIPHITALRLSRKSRVFQFASYAFDASVTDQLTTLLAGSCICVPSDMDRKNNLVKLAKQLEANWADLTPSVANLFRPEDIPNLDTLILGGEKLTEASITSWASDVQLINSYGPAECSAKSVARSDVRAHSDPRNIGRGVGCLCWIVDEHDHTQLVPIGAVGELLIEGPIVGRGYLNDPQKTAASFIESPLWLRRFRGKNGGAIAGRLYKTGDLVQYAADGSLRFVGRKDTQVKLRGQRIELGEVEHHVRRCFAGARDVVAEVVTPTEAGRQPILVAFVLVGEQNIDGSEDLLAAPTEAFRAAIPAAEAQLQDMVPAYMVPAVFLPLAAVPLTATGKTDRRRLRGGAAALSRAEIEAYAVPAAAKRQLATAAERSLQGLWVRVLNLPPNAIGADDSFFRLGGDSIAAMKLAGAAREDGFTLAVADVFQHPRLSDLSECLQSSTSSIAEPPAPFSLINHGETGDDVLQLAVTQCQVAKDRVTDIYPCTALQEGLVSLTLKTAGAYIAHFSFLVPGDLDLVNLRAAWDEVAQANPILHTRIIQHDTLGAFQVVVPTTLPWTVSDSQDYFRTAGPTSFALGEALIHVGVVEEREPGTQHRLILSMHHAIYDAWSLPLLLGQVEAALRGETLFPRPFSPFVAYLSQTRNTADTFWREELIDVSAVPFPPLPSPTHTPIPTASLTHTVPLQLEATNDFTISTIIRLAWAITLSQYTSSNDVIYGLTVTGRGAPVAGIEQMTGPTIATIPLRVRLNEDATVTESLRQVQDHSAQLLPYEQTGLHNIRRLSEEAAAACEFQNLLVIQPCRENGSMGIFKEADVMSSEGAFTTYALTLLCELSSNSVSVQATYDPQVIGAADLQRILYQLVHVTQEICRHPDKPIHEVGRLSPEDRLQLQQWNATVPARVERCVHDLIVEQCRAQPDAPAVCAWDGDFTYGELDRLSSGLAAHLAGLGVGPEVFVPVCFEKSRWTAVAMLGVMKAGGAFVLLDPSHPRARLKGICRQVSASVILTSPLNAPLATDLSESRVVIGEGQMVWRDIGPQVTPLTVTSNNALYAVFTSGSTGSPKGVVVTHASFSSSVLPYSEKLRLGPHSRILQFASHTFDGSIMDINLAFISGGRICLPSDSTQSVDIPTAVDKYKVNFAILTPTILNMLENDSLEELDTVVAVGEPLTSMTVNAWAPRLRLINAYGPAECSVVCALRRGMHPETEPRNIGYATGGVCWVVDPVDYERLLPIGAVGELLIEGPIVGRGYLNDAQRTAAAFIDPPAWLREFRAAHPGNPGGDRLYKTGDLVQYAADGSLRFVGRKGTQVKLRGQRIELGEVEHHVWQSFPGARDVVAEIVTPVGEDQPPMLVAFVCCESVGVELALKTGKDALFTAPSDVFRAKIPVAESRLHETVPAYMVPAVFIPLITIPLAKTGKTDRRRLCEQAAALSRSEMETYRGPKVKKRMPLTAAEQRLQQLWARVLHLPPDSIGADDSFFRLGGDSITAMKLASLARQEMLNLSTVDVFGHPKLSDLAAAVGQTPYHYAPTAKPCPFSLLGTVDLQFFLRQINACGTLFEADDIIDALPTTQFQHDYVINNKQCTYFHLYIPGNIDNDRLRKAWGSIVKQHAILRTVFIHYKDDIIQVILRQIDIQISKRTSGQDLIAFSKSLSREDSVLPVPLGALPFQLTLVSHGVSRHVLIVRLSHAQYDGFSIPKLYTDLAAAYHGNGLSATTDFSFHIQHRLLQKSTKAYQFWRGYLRGSSMTSLDHRVLGGDPSAVAVSVNAIKEISLPILPSGITVATVVKAAWSFVLVRLTRQRDLVFGHVVNGRSLQRSENISGPCVNIIPVRVTLQPSWTAWDLLNHVQSQHMRSMAFETSDLRDIVKHSTQWPADTRFGSIVQHQNIEMNTQISLDGIECTSATVAFPPVTKDFFVGSIPRGDRLEIRLSASSKMISLASADDVVEQVCATISKFSLDPSNPLLIPSDPA